MKRIAALSLALLMAMTATTTAYAAEVAALMGSWNIESFNGETPPPGVSMVLTFVDEDTISMKVTFNGQEQTEEVRYEASEDGTISFYPENEPESTGNWSIDAVGKLHIVVVEDGEEMEMILGKAG